MSNAIESLNGLLRGEISAVETYTQALKKVEAPTLKTTLTESLGCHQKRVSDIRDKVASLGGQPSESSGGWGVFAKFVQGAADIMGETAAIDNIEEGEDHGLKAYKDELTKCDDQAIREYIQKDLLPKQERTHEAARTLKKSLH
ncbi:MAG TPA: PA2169 family four-helix-bundle protein [Drouetiella sp.]